MIALISLFYFAHAVAQAQAAPSIATFLKPEAYEKITQQREIVSNADLETPDKQNFRKYQFHVAVLIQASLEKTLKVMTDYGKYKDFLPLIEKSDYTAAQRTLYLEGGIWGYQLRSYLKFEPGTKSPIRFRIVRGHLKDLEGEVLLERFTGKGAQAERPATLVLLRGTRNGKDWPPALIMENGAEIALSLTGQKMRSYIEGQEVPESAHAPTPTRTGDENAIPRPRRSL